MKLSARGRQILQNSFENEDEFIQDLQHGLVKQIYSMDVGIGQFQKLYQKKKVLSDTIDEYHQKNKYYQQDIQRAKQRIYQIAQLNDKANKQSILMRNQINKINDAHMMSKILMMEKILKLGMENESMERKRMQCNKIREHKNRVTNISQSLFEKKQRNRQLSVMESKAMKSYIEDVNYQTIQQKKSRADRIKSEKQRRRQRLLRYEKFKQQQAQKNYMAKTQNLKKNLQEKQKLLKDLCEQQAKQIRHYETTQHVTKQYIQSMFQTAPNTVQISSLFPTQTL